MADPEIVVLRAWDEFLGLGGKRDDTGKMEWGQARMEDFGRAYRWDGSAVFEGKECRPHESIGHVIAADVAMNIGVPGFGRLTRLLVPDGATVVPGQPLAEYELRSPTFEEWSKEWDRANRAQRRAGRLEDVLRHPFRAFWFALKDRLRRLRG
jgi:hypothetical protein